MIEEIILHALERGTGVPVYMEMPVDPPDAFCIIERTGGGQRGPEQRAALVAVQSYGQTLLEAAELNETVLDIMRELQYEELSVINCELNSAYNFTDENTKRYRYQAVFDLVYFA